MGMMTPVDNSHLTPLEVAATLTHEMYTVLQEAGFTPEAALEVVLRLINAPQDH